MSANAARSRSVLWFRGPAYVVLTWGVLCVVFGALANFYATQFGDDGFIFFRYAHNVARHGEVAWNVGAPPVEGYSSPLWLLLLTPAAWLSLDMLTYARVAGLAFAAGAVLGGVVLCRRLGGSAGASWIAALLSLVATGLLPWAGGGLETSLYAALVVWACGAVATRSEATLAFVAALLGLCRPEGGLMVVLLLGAHRWVHGRFRHPKLVIFVALAPVALWFTFRAHYYGAILPNTYYAKATGPLAQRLIKGSAYAASTLASYGLIFLAWLPQPMTARARAVRAVWLVGLVQTAVTVLGGGDWMWWSRLNVAAALLSFPLVTATLAERLRPSTARASRRLASAALLLLAGLVEGANARPGELVAALRGERLPAELRQEGTLALATQQLARYIGERYPERTLIAVNHAGMLPFWLPEHAFLDMTGLNDAHIARATSGGLHQKYDPAYVLRRAPGLVVLETYVRPGTNGHLFHPGYWSGTTLLVATPEFKRLYRLVPRAWHWRVGGHDVYTLLAERVDVAHSPR